MSHVNMFRSAAILAGLGASAAAMAVTPPNPKDLTQGSWELQIGKSHFCEAPPKSSHRDIVDAGWDLISVHWTGTNANGKPFDTRYVWKYDGQKYPAGITRGESKEAISWKLVNPNRVEFVHWSKDDKITQELVRTVSSDGQTMTQTTKIVGRAKAADGKDCIDSQVFQRQ